jgi:hypothetical protein
VVTWYSALLPPVETLIPSILGYREGVSKAFNSSTVMLGAFRFSLPGHFDAVGDFVCGKNIPRVRLYLKILGVRSMARLAVEDGAMVKSGQKVC